MLNSNVHSTIASAYLEGIRDLLEQGEQVDSVKDPTSIASNWGKGDRPAREIRGYSFRVNNPSSCLFISSERILRLPYMFGLFIWTIAGSNELNWLRYYNSLASNFSDDGKYLCGAFGNRLFDYKTSINQIDAICDLIQKDPTNRRTFAAICTPEDNILKSREYPCCIGIQYFLRGNALHTITYMRAQSILGVLPYDAFLFMALQCLLANRLGVKVGSYEHYAGTFHMYESEVADAESILSQEIESVTVGQVSSAASEIKDILRFEQELRNATVSNNVNYVMRLVLEKYDTENFWGQTRVVLLLHALTLLNLYDESEHLVAQLSDNFNKLAKEYIRKLR
jgi:thymidylate synthase